jgi:hypothetical protein
VGSTNNSGPSHDNGVERTFVAGACFNTRCVFIIVLSGM